MEWRDLTSASQLDTIIEESKHRPVVIFKHSTRCSISGAALNRLERNWKNDTKEAPLVYYLDLLSHRDISALIAQVFNVEHQSPQVLIIRNGKSVYDESHMGIDYGTIKSVMSSQPV